MFIGCRIPHRTYSFLRVSLFRWPPSTRRWSCRPSPIQYLCIYMLIWIHLYNVAAYYTGHDCFSCWPRLLRSTRRWFSPPSRASIYIFMYLYIYLLLLHSKEYKYTKHNRFVPLPLVCTLEKTVILSAIPDIYLYIHILRYAWSYMYTYIYIHILLLHAK